MSYVWFSKTSYASEVGCLVDKTPLTTQDDPFYPQARLKTYL